MSGEPQPKGHPSVSALVSICYVLQISTQLLISSQAVQSLTYTSCFHIHSTYFQVQNLVPQGHPDIDDLLLDRKEIPEWHPNLNLIVSRMTEPIEEPVADDVVSRYV